MSIENLVSGLVQYLATITELTSELGDSTGTPWIFEDEMFRLLEGSQEAALVITYAGQALSPNTYNTSLFVKLSIDVWVDPSRDTDGNPTDPSSRAAISKALKIWRILDKYLHRVGGGSQTWGSAVTLSSKRLSALSAPYMVPDGDGLIRGEASYVVEIA